jgi:hypothetical protein
MGEAELGLVTLRGDLKDNVGAVPLGFVFDEVNFGIQDMPHDFLARHQFSDPLGAAVNVLVAVRKLSTEFVGTTVNLS